MEKKILMGIVVIGVLLLIAIGAMSFILLTREPLIIEETKKKK